MTVRDKMFSEAFHGRLHRNKHRLSKIEQMSLDEFYEINKRAIDEMFLDMQTSLSVPKSDYLHEIMLEGVKSFLDVMRPIKSTIMHDINKTGAQPGWGYRVRKRRFNR